MAQRLGGMRGGRRAGTAAVLVLAGLWLLVAPPAPLVGRPAYLVVWFGLNCGIGALLGRWWAPLLAALPLVAVPPALWYNLRTERVAFIGDGVPLFLALLTLLGLLGLTLGALLGWRRAAP